MTLSAYRVLTREELDVVMQRYAEKDIPGAGGSIDVINMKWS